MRLLRNIKRKLPVIFPADTRPRILLFFPTILIQLAASAVSGIGFSLDSRNYWLAGIPLWLMWFAIIFFIVAPPTDRILQNHRQVLKRIAIMIFSTLIIFGLLEIALALFVAPGLQDNGEKTATPRPIQQICRSFQYNDGAALGHQAAENLLNGKNPYSHCNAIEAMLKHNGAFDRLTPLRTGDLADVFPYPSEEQLEQIWDTAIQTPSQPPPEIESHVCYPAGSFLLTAPFIATGIHDIRIVYIIFVIAGIIYAIYQIPKDKRLLFVAFALISVELWTSVADGDSGSLIFPLLLIAWVSLGKNRWVSAIAMGLAVASKQTAWFFLPFYLVLFWHTSGIKTFLAATGIIGVVFAVTNAYFIILDPGLWLRSILSPITDPLFPLGVGIIATVTSGLADIRSSLPFSILEIIVMTGSLAWYIRKCHRWPLAGLILAVLPLFFAWRSLWTYFYYIQIIILATMLTGDKTPANTTSSAPVQAGTIIAGNSGQ